MRVDALDGVDADQSCAEVDSCPFDTFNDGDRDSFCGNVNSCVWDGMQHDVDCDK